MSLKSKLRVPMALLAHEGHASARRFFNSGTAHDYDLVSFVTTFGRDRAWKRKIVEITGKRENILDLACGTGILSSMIAPSAKSVTGLDLTFEFLAHASKGFAICQGTAEILPFKDEIFDAVVSSYLAKYVDSRLAVRECWRVLQRGGVGVFHDFACPVGAMQGLWKAYFAILRLSGTFSRSWKPIFEELEDVICRSCWIENISVAMKESGFQNVTVSRHTFGTAAIVWGYKI